MSYTSSSSFQVGLRITSIFMATAGSLVVGVALLKLHHAMANSHGPTSIGNFRPLLKLSEKVSIWGISLLSIAAALSLTAEFLVLSSAL